MKSTLDILGPGGDWSHARVLVLGLGRSGQAMSGLLRRHGAAVLARDDRPRSAWDEVARALEHDSVEIIADAADPATVVQGVDVVVVSPGVPATNAWVRAAEEQGLPLRSELEVAARLLRGPIVAVTGTNGKSTTVALVDAMVRAAKRPSLLAGNIGTALSAVVDETDARTVAVLECSSFQLERLETFRATVAAILNVAPDHLDRYDGFESYAEAKRNLLARSGPEQFYVYAGDDVRLSQWAEACAAQPRPFALDAHDSAAAWVEEGAYFAAPGERVAALGDSLLVGRHNARNVLAAIAICRCLGIGNEAIVEALRGFEPLPHRAVLVPTSDGRRWIDDSKATNVHAASASLEGLEGPVVLLLGGRGKGEDYAPLGRFADRVRVAICYGEEGEQIARALEAKATVRRAPRLADALELAERESRSGDAILLSPACASFDEFTSFNARGDFFAQWVSDHAGGPR